MKKETIPLPNGGELVKEFYPNGSLKSESYYLNDKYHREDGPAYLAWYDNGTLESEIYYLNDKRHREGGPAVREWFSNGALIFESYYLNDKYHREDGPAYLYWDEQGTLKSEEYWLFGKALTESEFLQKSPLQIKLVADAFNNATPNQAIGLNF